MPEEYKNKLIEDFRQLMLDNEIEWGVKEFDEEGELVSVYGVNPEWTAMHLVFLETIKGELQLSLLLNARTTPNNERTPHSKNPL